MWDPAADRLLYVQAGRMFEVPVTLQPDVHRESREVFDERPTRVVLSQFADMTADGRGFVAVQRPPMSEVATRHDSRDRELVRGASITQPAITHSWPATRALIYTHRVEIAA